MRIDWPKQFVCLFVYVLFGVACMCVRILNLVPIFFSSINRSIFIRIAPFRWVSSGQFAIASILQTLSSSIYAFRVHFE